MAITSFAIASLASFAGPSSRPALPTPRAALSERRSPSPVAAASVKLPELADLLMERTVAKQCAACPKLAPPTPTCPHTLPQPTDTHPPPPRYDQYKFMRNRALQLWLGASWAHFLERLPAADSPMRLGRLPHFLSELQSAQRELFFVPTRSLQQGSPGNPYLPRASSGYTTEVAPPEVASMLMACREDLAHEWWDELKVLCTGEEHAALPDEQLLLGVATKAAARELLKELRLRPSQEGTCDWAAGFLREHAADFSARGSVDAFFVALENEPIRIRGRSLLDPLVLASEIKGRRVMLMEDMQGVLEATQGEQRVLKSDFLERCLKRI